MCFGVEQSGAHAAPTHDLVTYSRAIGVLTSSIRAMTSSSRLGVGPFASSCTCNHKMDGWGDKLGKCECAGFGSRVNERTWTSTSEAPRGRPGIPTNEERFLRLGTAPISNSSSSICEALLSLRLPKTYTPSALIFSDIVGVEAVRFIF